MGARVYRVNRVKLVNWMYLACGATYLLSGLLTENGYVWFAALTALAGVSGAVYQSAFTGIMQTKVEPSALGRVFSMFNTLSLFPAMIGLVGIGFFADGLGLTTSFILCGAIIITLGVVAFLIPSAMALDRPNAK